MDNIILHDTTQQQIAGFLAQPSHALLIVGPNGIGKYTVAQSIASKLMEVAPSVIGEHPNVLLVQAEPQGTISIESIRNAQRFLQLKTVGTQAFRRAIIIEHADGLTTEAQNAFLKLLEEPPADTVLILTAPSPRALLPTILSRVQRITVHAPLEAQLQPLLTQSTKSETEKRQAYFLSGGLPGLLSALLQDSEHPLLASITQAKEILQKNTFERLLMVDTLSKQREITATVLDALLRIAQTGIAQATEKADSKRLQQWHAVRKKVDAARTQLMHSVNLKLCVTNLFLQL